MGTLSTSFIFALGASMASVIGGVMVTRYTWATRSLRYFIALGAGFMLGTVFIEMAPVSFRQTTAAPALILLGYLIVHFFEHVFATHLHFGEETHHHEKSRPAVEFSALVGLLVHTFFDGVSIGAGFQVSQGLGLLIFLAVVLHKIPDGFTISSIFVNAGHSAGQAQAAAIALGVSTLVGVLAVNLVGRGLEYALPISTGSTLYVAATDLMPEANRESGVRMAFIVFAGIALFFLMKTLTGDA
ncbi:MAG TPA: ZIP family metal transporter [Terriglobia bacterium]|nr:ZIP family metal transporter [Terriglobia bacterium]